jgi:hypothetical protein
MGRRDDRVTLPQEAERWALQIRGARPDRARGAHGRQTTTAGWPSDVATRAAWLWPRGRVGDSTLDPPCAEQSLRRTSKRWTSGRQVDDERRTQVHGGGTAVLTRVGESWRRSSGSRIGQPRVRATLCGCQPRRSGSTHGVDIDRATAFCEARRTNSAAHAGCAWVQTDARRGVRRRRNEGRSGDARRCRAARTAPPRLLVATGVPFVESRVRVETHGARQTESSGPAVAVVQCDIRMRGQGGLRDPTE